MKDFSYNSCKSGYLNIKIIILLSGGGFNISPLKRRNGRPRTQVEHLMQIDLKGWGVGYVSAFQQHCLLQMLNSVAGDSLSFFMLKSNVLKMKNSNLIPLFCSQRVKFTC